jgi:hypothetical protein
MATPLPPESSDETSDESEVRYRKPRPDLYTALLVIALTALILGCVMLYLELQFYEFKYRGAPSVSWHAPAVSAPLLSAFSCGPNLYPSEHGCSRPCAVISEPTWRLT